MSGRVSSTDFRKMSLLSHVVTLSLVLQTVVMGQDNYGSPNSPVLSPSSVSSVANLRSQNLRVQPANFQSLIGNPSFSARSGSSGSSFSSNSGSGFTPSSSGFSSSGSSSGFSSSGSSFSSGSGSSRFSSGSGSSFSNADDLIIDNFAPFSSSSSSSSSSSGRSPSSIGLSNSITASSFNSATPPTIINPQRFSSNSLQNSFSRQTSSRGSSARQTLPALSGPNGGSSGTVTGGIDFSQATRTADGRLCVIKEESVETVSKDPILECKHKNIEKCHYTYITYFKPAQEEVCEENFEKKCQITFAQQAIKETIRKCYRPQEKVCNGQGEEECRTVYESSCSTRYIEKSPGKFVGDTACEKLPVEICGRGCVNQEGAEECHEKEVDSLVDVPEEVCDLNPQKTCRLQTKLVPSLKPKQECTVLPQETCNLKFSQPKRTKKPLRTEWCLDEESSSGSAAQPNVQNYSRNQ